MQAIKTKYIPASNTKPSRVAASCDAGRVVLSWDSGLDTAKMHREACRALMQKLGWWDSPQYAAMVGGTMSDGTMTWVFMDDTRTDGGK